MARNARPSCFFIAVSTLRSSDASEERRVASHPPSTISGGWGQIQLQERQEAPSGIDVEVDQLSLGWIASQGEEAEDAALSFQHMRPQRRELLGTHLQLATAAVEELRVVSPVRFGPERQLGEPRCLAGSGRSYVGGGKSGRRHSVRNVGPGMARWLYSYRRR